MRRKIEERLKASGEDRAAADPPPVASPSTYSVTSEAEKPWLLWTGGAAIAITGIGAYYLVRVRHPRSAKPAPRPEKSGEPEAFISVSSPARGKHGVRAQMPKCAAGFANALILATDGRGG